MKPFSLSDNGLESTSLILNEVGSTPSLEVGGRGWPEDGEGYRPAPLYRWVVHPAPRVAVP